MAGQRLRLKPVGTVCGKRRFYDSAAAERFRQFIESLNRARGGAASGLRVAVYHCPQCDALHVGRSS